MQATDSQLSTPSTPEVAHSAPDTLDIRGLYAVLQRRWKVITGVALAVTLLTFVIVMMQTKLYTAQTVLQFESRKQTVASFESVLAETPPEEAFIKTEIDVVRSRYLAGRIIDKLNLANDKEFNPSLEGPGVLSSITDFLGGMVESTDPAQQQEIERRRLRSKMIDKVLEQLEAYAGPKSYTLYIRFTSESPDTAARVANTFAEEYLTYQLEKKYQATKRANDWLNNRLQELRKKLRESEAAVAAFRDKHGLVAKDDRSISDQQLNELNTQLILARSERAQAEARLNRAQQLRGSGGGESINEVLDSYLIQRLREQETNIVRERADLASRYGQNHPRMIKVNNELRDVQAKIKVEINKIMEGLRNEVVIARSREQSLESSLASLQGKVGQSNRAEVELAELERQQEANRTLYNALLGRFKETSQGQDLQQVDASVISAAEAPVKASWPPRLLFLVLALFIGTVLGTTVAFILEMLDNGFRSIDQIARATGIAGIGMVPAIKGKHSPVHYSVEHPTSAYAESLRTVMTAVHFSNPDAPPKSLLVLSSIPKEGKSSFALSLARLYAKSGHKVLLVDCDLRRPTVSKNFGVEPRHTLSDLITGVAGLEDVIHSDSATGLHYIASSPNTPNSQELLSSRKMQDFLNQMRDRYDLVVLDAPPVLALSDGIRLSKMVDSTLFLVRWEKTPRNVVLNALRQLTVNHVKLAGVVLSRVDLDKHKQYNYGDNAYIYTTYKDYYSS